MEKFKNHLITALGFTILLGVLIITAPRTGNTQNNGLEGRVKALEATVVSLQNQITNIQLTPGATGPAGPAGPAGATGATGPAGPAGPAGASPFTVDGTEVYLSGYNLHIVNGTGHTYNVNSLGNLILGYHESRGTGLDRRTGSHNIIAGYLNNYTSYGSIVAGLGNEASGQGACVAGGTGNYATGDYSSVCGGYGNTASGYASSVTGGLSNTASGNYTWVSGGDSNLAVAGGAAISGGYKNTASGGYSTVTGGQNNTAGFFASSVSGGTGRSAPSTVPTSDWAGNLGGWAAGIYSSPP